MAENGYGYNGNRKSDESRGSIAPNGPSRQSLGTIGVDDVLRFQQQRILTRLFKSFLVLLEDLNIEHEEAMRKLRNALPQEYKDRVDLADYWTEARAESMRSKVLDVGNDAIRQLNEQLDNFDITIRSGKGAII